MGQEYIETLKKVREQLVINRRACLQTLAEAFEGPPSIEALATFKSLQETIIAIDLAIADENRIKTERRSEEAIEETRRRTHIVRSWTHGGVARRPAVVFDVAHRLGLIAYKVRIPTIRCMDFSSATNQTRWRVSATRGTRTLWKRDVGLAHDL
jgi:hypothetical protein